MLVAVLGLLLAGAARAGWVYLAKIWDCSGVRTQLNSCCRADCRVGCCPFSVPMCISGCLPCCAGMDGITLIPSLAGEGYEAQGTTMVR